MKTSLRLLLAAIALFGLQVVNAASVTYEFDYSFGDMSDIDYAPPDGASPWLTATIDDGGTPDSVTLTMTFGADNGENTINGVYFNLDPLLSAGDLTYTYVSGPDATVRTSGNLTAGASGEYDIFFDFPPPPGGPSTDYFEAGETVVYTITGAGLDAFSFEYQSETGMRLVRK